MNIHASAKKSLGQHFLKDPNTAKKIADLGKISSTSQVIEIGPGRGALTQFLIAQKPAKLLLLEKDDNYSELHRTENSANESIEIIEGDALKFNWSTLEDSWIIMGNLPYNIASPLMWDIAAYVPNLERAVFLIQKEVALRIVSGPNSKQYGALSVWIQSFCEVKKHFTLPPSAFNPPPQVDSTVVEFKKSQIRPNNPEKLSKTIKIAFSQRRKQLVTILKNNGYADASHILQSCGLDEKLRPENLTIQDFWKLSELL